jgi:hypothetical protein
MINVLIASLTELLVLEQDFKNGHADIEDVNEAKKRFISALHAIIDYRVNLANDERRKHLSQERIAIADTINASLQSTATTVRTIAALNSAPPPPNDPSNRDEIKRWVEEYNRWYDNQREKGMKIG